ncbi:hypothetical protein Tco_1097193 [Tanacetum coccineum]
MTWLGNPLGNEESTAYVVDNKGCKRHVSWQGSINKKEFAAVEGQHDDVFAAMAGLIAIYLIQLESCNIELWQASNFSEPLAPI